MDNKTVAERLREAECNTSFYFDCNLHYALKGEDGCGGMDCADCRKLTANTLADMIEGATPSKSTGLPEGTEWPRFTDGELVKFGDEYVNALGNTAPVERIMFTANGYKVNRGQRRNFMQEYGTPVKRPEPEVLDADGVPINAGDTVYGTGREQYCYTVLDPASDEFERRFTVKCACANDCETCYCDPSMLTHRKPDTAESLLREFIEAAKSDDGPDLTPIIERSLKLLGGEQHV